MYATKAMEYYRKLLISKAFKEREPDMPGRKKAYTSIFQKQLSPSKGEQRNNNIREKRINKRDTAGQQRKFKRRRKGHRSGRDEAGR